MVPILAPRLVASLCYLRLDEKRFDDAEAISRWLVLEINPNDNHGLRAEFTRLALQRGDPRAALEWARQTVRSRVPR